MLSEFGIGIRFEIHQTIDVVFLRKPIECSSPVLKDPFSQIVSQSDIQRASQPCNDVNEIAALELSDRILRFGIHTP